MTDIHICPSTLAAGYSTYSPEALKLLFDGKKVSHIFPGLSPLNNSWEAKEAYKQVGRISLSGVQSKLAAVTEDGRFRFAKEGERGLFMLKPKPSASFLYQREDCPANENLTMQIASQVYHIETAANGLVVFDDDDMAYITRRFDVSADGSKYQQEDFAALMGYTKANIRQEDRTARKIGEKRVGCVQCSIPTHRKTDKPFLSIGRSEKKLLARCQLQKKNAYFLVLVKLNLVSFSLLFNSFVRLTSWLPVKH